MALSYRSSQVAAPSVQPASSNSGDDFRIAHRRKNAAGYVTSLSPLSFTNLPATITPQGYGDTDALLEDEILISDNNGLTWNKVDRSGGTLTGAFTVSTMPTDLISSTDDNQDLGIISASDFGTFASSSNPNRVVYVHNNSGSVQSLSLGLVDTLTDTVARELYDRFTLEILETFAAFTASGVDTYNQVVIFSDPLVSTNTAEIFLGVGDFTKVRFTLQNYPVGGLLGRQVSLSLQITANRLSASVPITENWPDNSLFLGGNLYTLDNPIFLGTDGQVRVAPFRYNFRGSQITSTFNRIVATPATDTYRVGYSSSGSQRVYRSADIVPDTVRLLFEFDWDNDTQVISNLSVLADVRPEWAVSALNVDSGFTWTRATFLEFGPSGELRAATDDDSVYGVSLSQSGSAARSGYCLVTLAGSVTVGQRVGPNSSGLGVASTTGPAYALQAGDSGDTVLVDLLAVGVASGSGGGGGATNWGDIGGTLSDQADLNLLLTGLRTDVDDHETRITTLESSGGGGSVAWGSITGTLSNQTDLDTRLSGVETANTTQDGRLDTAETDITALETEQTTQNTRLDGAETNITNIQAEQTTQNTRLTDLETEQSSQDTRITTLESGGGGSVAWGSITGTLSNQTDLDTRLSGIETVNTTQDGRLDTAETDITTLETGQITQNGRLDTLETEQTSQDTRITTLENAGSGGSVAWGGITGTLSNQTDLETRLSSIEATNTAQGGRLDTAETDITALETGQTTQNTRLDTAETDITALETGQTTQNTRLDTAETDITALETEQTTQNTRLGTAETNITNIQAEQTTQNTRLTDLETEQSSQDTRITTLESGGGGSVAWGSITGTLSNQTDLDTRLSGIETINTTQDNRLTDAEADIVSLEAEQVSQGSRITDLEAIPVSPLIIVQSSFTQLTNTLTFNTNNAFQDLFSVNISCQAGDIIDLSATIPLRMVPAFNSTSGWDYRILRGGTVLYQVPYPFGVYIFLENNNVGVVGANVPIIYQDVVPTTATHTYQIQGAQANNGSIQVSTGGAARCLRISQLRAT